MEKTVTYEPFSSLRVCEGCENSWEMRPLACSMGNANFLIVNYCYVQSLVAQGLLLTGHSNRVMKIDTAKRE